MGTGVFKRLLQWLAGLFESGVSSDIDSHAVKMKNKRYVNNKKSTGNIIYNGDIKISMASGADGKSVDSIESLQLEKDKELFLSICDAFPYTDMSKFIDYHVLPGTPWDVTVLNRLDLFIERLSLDVSREFYDKEMNSLDENLLSEVLHFRDYLCRCSGPYGATKTFSWLDTKYYEGRDEKYRMIGRELPIYCSNMLKAYNAFIRYAKTEKNIII